VSLVSQVTALAQAVAADIKALSTDKQDTLVSGTNIKTVGGVSLLGSGDVPSNTGPAGADGDTGATGPTGDTGATGTTGATGVSTQSIPIACSDETTALTAGVAKVTFRMPFAFTLSGVRASLTTAQATGTIFTVDINKGGTSILSTKLTIDNTEKSSVTAATPVVISDTALANDAEIKIDIDQIGSSGGTGLKVYLIGSVA